MTETFEERTDRHLAQMEQTLRNIEERTAGLPELIAEVVDSVRITDNQVRTLASLQEQNSRNIVRLYEMWNDGQRDIQRLYSQWTEHYREGHVD
jgi:septal ring factor EnvC (AmiA/AmiB activator)